MSIVDAGIRACLPEEFSSVYFLNLRGKAQGAPSEGEGVFRNATQSPVAIVIFVKNPDATHEGCHIHYREIGDALKREEKFTALRDAVSVSGFNDWQIVTPNEKNDWIEHRSDSFDRFYPLGSDEARDGKADDAIFKLYSRGVTTGRDPHLYNFSRDTCTEKAKRMTQEYLDAISESEENPELALDEVTSQYKSEVKWDEDLENNLKRRKKTKFEDKTIRKVLHRPFILTNCYADYIFIQRKYQMDKIFPDASSENRVICVPGKGAKKQFSTLVTDTIADVNLNEAGAQCFPRYRYLEQMDSSEDTTHMFQGIDNPPDRIDNISDTALSAFRKRYPNETITKDAIFDYVYGILHAPSYKKQFANDLSKMLPHIPYAPDFRAFKDAGKALADLHLNYENCERYPHLSVEPRKQDLFWQEKPEHLLLDTRGMYFKDKNTKDTLIINKHVQLSGIPEEAHRYVVNGRTPLEWFINRYKIKPPEKNNGILNDPNGWFEKPRDLVTAIERIVYVSVESTKIIEGLPSEITAD